MDIKEIKSFKTKNQDKILPISKMMIYLRLNHRKDLFKFKIIIYKFRIRSSIMKLKAQIMTIHLNNIQVKQRKD